MSFKFLLSKKSGLEPKANAKQISFPKYHEGARVEFSEKTKKIMSSKKRYLNVCLDVFSFFK